MKDSRIYKQLYVEPMVKAMLLSTSINTPLTNRTIVDVIKTRFPLINYNPAEVRVYINTLRRNGFLILSNSKGYFHEEDSVIALGQAISLEERAASILAAAQGIRDAVMKRKENNIDMSEIGKYLDQIDFIQYKVLSRKVSKKKQKKELIMNNINYRVDEKKCILSLTTGTRDVSGGSTFKEGEDIIPYLIARFGASNIYYEDSEMGLVKYIKNII